jgi:hypothetical protein
MPFNSLHIFQPSFLMGSRTEQRAGEGIGLALAKALQFAFVSAAQASIARFQLPWLLQL